MGEQDAQKLKDMPECQKWCTETELMHNTGKAQTDYPDDPAVTSSVLATGTTPAGTGGATQPAFHSTSLPTNGQTGECTVPPCTDEAIRAQKMRTCMCDQFFKSTPPEQLQSDTTAAMQSRRMLMVQQRSMEMRRRLSETNTENAKCMTVDGTEYCTRENPQMRKLSAQDALNRWLEVQGVRHLTPAIKRQHKAHTRANMSKRRTSRRLGKKSKARRERRGQ